eukprot:NODE_745_length_2130_cov_93.263577_g710_i0.p1 GENE.NODE_745_length_2130_cov_93.263577_g710_i0~~NODE_745_length_2130_cov_93.263577_g710_i0.p1  ORF type:complete len:596 (-),score=96.66 NODE_745_length_2130_cov_93.263577_g710_i0:180-1967(-)
MQYQKTTLGLDNASTAFDYPLLDSPAASPSISAAGSPSRLGHSGKQKSAHFSDSLTHFPSLSAIPYEKSFTFGASSETDFAASSTLLGNTTCAPFPWREMLWDEDEEAYETTLEQLQAQGRLFGFRSPSVIAPGQSSVTSPLTTDTTNGNGDGPRSITISVTSSSGRDIRHSCSSHELESSSSGNLARTSTDDDLLPASGCPDGAANGQASSSSPRSDSTASSHSLSSSSQPLSASTSPHDQASSSPKMAESPSESPQSPNNVSQPHAEHTVEEMQGALRKAAQAEVARLMLEDEFHAAQQRWDAERFALQERIAALEKSNQQQQRSQQARSAMECRAAEAHATAAEMYAEEVSSRVLWFLDQPLPRVEIDIFDSPHSVASDSSYARSAQDRSLRISQDLRARLHHTQQRLIQLSSARDRAVDQTEAVLRQVMATRLVNEGRRDELRQLAGSAFRPSSALAMHSSPTLRYMATSPRHDAPDSPTSSISDLPEMSTMDPSAILHQPDASQTVHFAPTSSFTSSRGGGAFVAPLSPEYLESPNSPDRPRTLVEQPSSPTSTSSHQSNSHPIYNWMDLGKTPGSPTPASTVRRHSSKY